MVGEHAIFCSNTSSLCITELAAKTKRPDRFAGLHFFNPVPLMKLVEVIRGLTTSDDTYQQVFAFAQSLGKEPITAPDKPGFIVNRLLVPYLLDAIRSYEHGLGTIEDIDKGMKLGTGYPMGPFTLLDFVGLDTTYYIANIMFEEYREPAYAPPPLLKRMVLAGWLGKKSGRGFYRVLRSVIPERLDRIERGRAPRGHQAGQRGDREQERGHRGEGDRVGRAHAVEQARRQAAERQRDREPGQRAGDRQRQSLHQNLTDAPAAASLRARCGSRSPSPAARP